MEQHVGHQHEQDQEHREPQDQQPELADPDFERVRRALRGERAGEPAQCRTGRGAADQHYRGATDHRRAHEDRGSGGVVGLLFSRVGLPGQQGLVDEQIARLQQPAIGGHDVARAKMNHVARDEAVDRHHGLGAIPPHVRLQGYGTAEGLDRVLGPNLLDEVQHHAEQDDHSDDHETCEIAGNG